MPYRPNSRGQNAFRAFADYLAQQSGQLGDYFLKQADRQQANQIETERLKANDISQLGREVSAKPNDYETIIQAAKANPRLSGVDLSSLIPSDNTLLKGLTDQINNAKSESDLPASVSAGALSAGVKPIPALPFGQGSGQQFAEPGSFDAPAMNKPGVVDLQTLLDTAKGKLADQQAQHVRDIGNQAYAGAYGSSSGQTQAATDYRDAINENSSTKAYGDTYAINLAANDPYIAELAALKAGKEEGARAAAQAPYQTPTFGTDADGNDMALRFGPGGAKPVPLPEGFNKSTPVQKLSSLEHDNLASMNSAEVTAVKMLADLHNTGADLSNNPTDPRYTKFLTNTLKIAPNDLAKGTMQQRAAYVQAQLLSSLIKNRPNKDLLEILKAHTPSGEMTGQQLSNVLKVAFEEVGQKRREFEAATGRKEGAFEPVSGMTFKQYMKQTGQQGPVLPPGTLPPLDPSLDAILKRGSHGG